MDENTIIESLKIKLNNPLFGDDDFRHYSKYPDVMNSATNYDTSIVVELPELGIFAAVLKSADCRTVKYLDPKVNRKT